MDVGAGVEVEVCFEFKFDGDAVMYRDRLSVCISQFPYKFWDRRPNESKLNCSVRIRILECSVAIRGWHCCEHAHSCCGENFGVVVLMV